MGKKKPSRLIRDEAGRLVLLPNQAFQTMEIIRKHPGISVTEIAERMEQMPAVIYAMIKTLYGCDLLDWVHMTGSTAKFHYLKTKYELMKFRMIGSGYREKITGKRFNSRGQDILLMQIADCFYLFNDSSWSVYEHIMNMTAKNEFADRHSYVKMYDENHSALWRNTTAGLLKAGLVVDESPGRSYGKLFSSVDMGPIVEHDILFHRNVLK